MNWIISLFTVPWIANSIRNKLLLISGVGTVLLLCASLLGIWLAWSGIEDIKAERGLTEAATQAIAEAEQGIHLSLILMAAAIGLAFVSFLWLVQRPIITPKMPALIIEPHFPAPGVYEVKVCTQCGDCAAVCPVDCIKQNEKGAYYLVQEDCIMCEACVPECPEGVMFMRADLVPNTAWECDLCGDCVEVCGTGALWIAEKA